VIGQEKIEVLQYKDYQKLANNLLDRGLKPKTVKNIFLVLRGMYKFAKKNDWVSSTDPIEYVEFPKFDNRRYFTINVTLQVQYIRAIMNFNEDIYRDIFLFLLHGRRLNEVLDLKWQYIDLNEGILYLPAKRNKSRKNLSFQLTDRLIEALKRYQLEAIDRENTPFIQGYVFVNPRTGTRFNDLRKPWKRLLDLAQLPKIRIHDIRHLVATYAINELELPIEKVSHALGHSDIKVTQGYINPNPANSKLVIESIFDSVKTKEERSIDELDYQVAIGEVFQDAIETAASKHQKYSLVGLGFDKAVSTGVNPKP
jgi:integrase